MNAYHNSWPEEHQHLQRHQDLLSEAEHKRLIRLARGQALTRQRGALSGYAYAAWNYSNSRLHTWRHRLAERLHPTAPTVSADCR